MKWERKPLTDFVWFQRGFDLPKDKFVNGEFPVVGSTSILGYHTEAKVKAPGIVTGRSGTIGQFQFMKNDFWPHNTSLWVKDFYGNDERFAFYLLHTLDFISLNGGGAVPSLNRNFLSSINVNVPPLPTQRKIASILSAYDDLIENNLKRIKLLEEKAFRSYKLIVKIDSEKLKLEELYDTSSGGTPSRTNAEYFTGDINWFKSKELADSILLDSEEKITEQAVDKSSAKLFPAGSVILAMYGATIGKLGLLSQPSTTNQACCAIIQKDEIKSNYYILNWLIENREYVLSFRMGAAQENISQQVIRNLLVSIPKDNDLKIFNQEMKPIYQLIKNLHQQNTKLREARDILLPKLISGQIEV
jgi:type I restriction enzyme S subunit